MTKPHILVIDNDLDLVATVADLLTGYVVQTASDGDAGLAFATSYPYDAILLDATLPGKIGLEVCRELRLRGVETPILLFTARGQVRDRIAGLQMGADDCLTKPFNSSELLARLEAVLRRTRKLPRVPDSTFRFGGVEVDFARAEVVREGQPVRLASKELELLRYLILHRERVVPREELMRRVWDYASDTSSRTVDTHVVWLRHKLEANPQTPQHIQTVRGRGYRFIA